VALGQIGIVTALLKSCDGEILIGRRNLNKGMTSAAKLGSRGSEDGEAETEICRAAKPSWRTMTRTSGPQGSTLRNRPVRTPHAGSLPLMPILRSRPQDRSTPRPRYQKEELGNPACLRAKLHLKEELSLSITPQKSSSPGLLKDASKLMPIWNSLY
jgi:hypothetical protein